MESDLQRTADTVAGLVERSPFLLGDRPILCDFALLGQMLYWIRAPKTGRAVNARPAIAAYLDRMNSARAGQVATPAATAP
jgi:glutathione S-transferase